MLVDNCYKCHSAEAEKVKGELLLDTRDGLRKGGDTGPIIVPGNPERSLLIHGAAAQEPGHRDAAEGEAAGRTSSPTSRRG